jgi:hypothetical protein
VDEGVDRLILKQTFMPAGDSSRAGLFFAWIGRMRSRRQKPFRRTPAAGCCQNLWPRAVGIFILSAE